jgi:hypothetical protein
VHPPTFVDARCTSIFNVFCSYTANDVCANCICIILVKMFLIKDEMDCIFSLVLFDISSSYCINSFIEKLDKGKLCLLLFITPSIFKLLSSFTFLYVSPFFLFKIFL